MNERIQQVHDLGQSLWIDNLHRDLLDSRKLARWIETGVGGVTSNPTIFEQAIRRQPSYQQEVARLAQTGAQPAEVYDALVREDLQRAANLLRPVWEARDHRDGFVSLEVSPLLADDTQRTVAEGERLWSLVERPNVFIKVPATPAGLPAIAQLIERGVAVNVTLIFSITQWRGVVEAYQQGLEARARDRKPLEVASVASFFVSRIDSAIDKRLPESSRLRGRIGIANAKVAYQRWREHQGEARWRSLASLGARPQRLLWGSTGTKDPAYRDVMYVEELLGPDTINTMPDATFEAFLDHGRVRPSLLEAPDEACADLAELTAHRIDLDEVCEQLQQQGVRKFADSFHATMQWLTDRDWALAGSSAAPV